MPPRSSRRALLVAAPAIIVATVATAAEPVRIRIDYVFSAIRLDGGARIPSQTRWSVGTTLLGNRVTESWEGRSAGLRKSRSGQDTLGGRWQVVDESTLMRVSDFPTSEMIVRVMVQGQSCRATVESRLKPGRSTYLFRSLATGRLAEYLDPSYSDVQCSIS